MAIKVHDLYKEEPIADVKTSCKGRCYPRFFVTLTGKKYNAVIFCAGRLTKPEYHKKDGVGLCNEFILCFADPKRGGKITEHKLTYAELSCFSMMSTALLAKAAMKAQDEIGKKQHYIKSLKDSNCGKV